VHIVNYNNGLYSIRYPNDTLFDKVCFFLIADVAAKLIPMIITSVCYYKVYCVIKKSKSHGDLSPVKTLFYPLSQIVCFAPGVVADFIFLFVLPGQHYPFAAGITINTLHRSWGFLSLMAYWFVKPKEQDEQKLLSDKESSINQISLTLNTDL